MTDFRILILDDDPDDAFLVSETLSDVLTTSYETTSCTTTTEAFQRLTAEPFDLLICDYQLGAEDGASFISSLKPRGVDLPAILLTGMAHDEAERLAIEAGAVDFLPKGELSATVLDRTIRFAIANVRRHSILSTMVDCMDAAVCIDDGAGRPELWNAGFTALASRYVASTNAVSCNEVADLLHSTLQGRVSNIVGDVMVDLNITRIADGRSVVTLHDVSEHVRALQEREEAVRKADHLATHCCLTRLPNRSAITKRIDEATAAVAVSGAADFTLLVLDLDRFKGINDVHGHAVGDAVLIQVADRMQATLGPEDSLGRMGGDEFVVLSGGQDNAEQLAHDLIASFDEPFQVEGCLHSLGVSIGIASCPQHGRTTQELMSNADHAMYRAKKDPAVPYLCYTDEIDRQTRERLHLVSDLKEAIASDAIDVHFQPQVDAITGVLSGFEALARWNRPGF
ncbi:diguanylate cyclase, partial [Rhizobiaceae bacterium]|nr:diguanylate cyclase [Rhizobiaceae bacterium]